MSKTILPPGLGEKIVDGCERMAKAYARAMVLHEQRAFVTGDDSPLRPSLADCSAVFHGVPGLPEIFEAEAVAEYLRLKREAGS